MIPRVGIELEYMIVDRGTLDVRPIADELLRARAGELTGEVEVGSYCWSNELVLHVVELKTNGPVDTLAGVAEGFQRQVGQIDDLLGRWNARLMPAAMHPWMDPLRETRIWPHDNAEIYAAFDRIFGCRGHGWSNLQSMHLNFPFESDDDFGRLHAAIRLVLPILPALAASSPVMDGRLTGRLDNRVDVYRTNCARIPSVTGHVIPEPVFTPAEYQDRILGRIYDDLRGHDPDGILRHEWVNARGAIARFERNTIEIRLIDMQECPAADIAIAALVWASLEALMEERWASLAQQRGLGVEPLEQILSGTLGDSRQNPFTIRNEAFLACFGRSGTPETPAALWRRIAMQLLPDILRTWGHTLTTGIEAVLLRQNGPLASRIVQRLDGDSSRASLRRTYGALADCLAAGKMIG